MPLQISIKYALCASQKRTRDAEQGVVFRFMQICAAGREQVAVLGLRELSARHGQLDGRFARDQRSSWSGAYAVVLVVKIINGVE